MNGAWVSLLLLMLRCALPTAVAPLISRAIVCRTKQVLESVKPVGSDPWWITFCAACMFTTCLPQAPEPGMLLKGDRGREFCGCFSGTSHCGPLRGLSTLPEQRVAQFVLKSREEEGNTEAKRQWGLGKISCKCFNLGCVLQPGEKSKLPDGTLVTILSSLPVWQEVFAAPCFPDDRLLWFDLACFRMAGGWGVHDRELGFGELYLVRWGDVRAVPSPLE